MAHTGDVSESFAPTHVTQAHDAIVGLGVALSGRPVPGVCRGRPKGSCSSSEGRTTARGWRAAAGMLAAQSGRSAGRPPFRARHRWPRTLCGTGSVAAGTHWRRHRILAGRNRSNRRRRRRCEHVAIPGRVAATAGHLCDWFDAGEVKARWPWIGPSQGAVWAPRDAALHPVRLVEALTKDAERLGTTVGARHRHRHRATR